MKGFLLVCIVFIMSVSLNVFGAEASLEKESVVYDNVSFVQVEDVLIIDVDVAPVLYCDYNYVLNSYGLVKSEGGNL